MFEARLTDGNRVLLSGRLDASQAEQLKSVLDTVKESCVVDFSELQYISSAGLGMLLATQKRLGESGHSLKLVNLPPRIKDIFLVAGFNFVFKIE